MDYEVKYYRVNISFYYDSFAAVQKTVTGVLLGIGSLTPVLCLVDILTHFFH